MKVRQIYSDYHLPVRPDELSLEDIDFWYEPLVDGILELQRNEKEMKKNG